MTKFHYKIIRDFILIALLVILAIRGVSAQTGLNGVNFFQYSTEQDWQKLIDASGDTISFRYRFDKRYGNDKVKLVDFVLFANSQSKVVWLTLTSDMNPDSTSDAVGYLESHGVKVNVVELGNEEYSETTPKLDFDAYRAMFEPVISACQYDVIFTLCAPPRPKNSGIQGGRNDHQLWHDALEAYLVDKPYGINWHIYYNNRDCPILSTKPAKRAYSVGFYQDLYDYYSALDCQLDTSILWAKTLDYINLHYPNRYVSISEFGIVAEGDGETSGGAGSIKNTLVYAKEMFNVWLEYRNEFNTMDIHSGVALTGMITPSGKFDLFTGNQTRTEFYAFQLANEIVKLELDDTVKIVKAGVYFLPLEVPVIESDLDLTITTRFVEGQYPYSTAGYAEWMGPGTTKNQEIQGIQEMEGIYLPEWGFGYIKVIACETEEIKTLNPEWTKCQRPFWKLFRKSYCSSVEQYLITYKTICEGNAEFALKKMALLSCKTFKTLQKMLKISLIRFQLK